MEYAHAVLALAENDRELSEQNITAVLEAAGTEVTESRVKAFVAALEGVDIDAVNEQALALSSPEGTETAPAPDPDEVTDSVTTEAFTRDFSPADLVDLDEGEGGAFDLDPYGPEEETESTDDADDSEADTADSEADTDESEGDVEESETEADAAAEDDESAAEASSEETGR